MLTLAFAHLKGGTGKTTACINVAGCLERQGKKVLVIDLDPQANATGGLGIDPGSVSSSMYEVLLGKNPLTQIILKSKSGVFVAPGSYALMDVQFNEALTSFLSSS